jgi:hypothetical protein
VQERLPLFGKTQVDGLVDLRNLLRLVRHAISSE